MPDDLDELELDIEGEEAKKKPKSKLIMIVVAAVVVLAGGGGAGYFVFMGDDKSAEVKTAENKATEEKAEQGSGDAGKKQAFYHSLSPAFVVNLRDENGNKAYLHVNVTVMTRDKGLVEVIKLHQPLIKNDLLGLFSVKEIASLKTIEGKKKLREEALKTVQDSVKEQTGKDGVTAVLFTEFIME